MDEEHLNVYLFLCLWIGYVGRLNLKNFKKRVFQCPDCGSISLGIRTESMMESYLVLLYEKEKKDGGARVLASTSKSFHQ